MFKTKCLLKEMQTLFSRYEFENIVKEYKGDKNVRNFSTWEMSTVLLYSQLTGKSSLRDIEISMRSKSNYWAHMGIKSISRNNLSNSLMKRDFRIFEELFYKLHSKMQKSKFQNNDKRFTISNKLIAIDSTTIPLCLNLCSWAKFRKEKGGIKVHTMFNIKNQIPDFAIISNAVEHDVQAAKKMPFEKDGIYIIDRAYCCVKLFKNINENGAFFITRTKSNTKYRTIRRKLIGGENRIEDCVVDFTNSKKTVYSERLRVIRFYDPMQNKTYEFITNNFSASAEEIAGIYKARWDIELFFKHIKQNLKIKHFYGTSENAVKTQIWIAMISVLLVNYVRFISKSLFSNTEIIRVIRENMFSGKSLRDLICPVKHRPLSDKELNCEIQGCIWS